MRTEQQGQARLSEALTPYFENRGYRYHPALRQFRRPLAGGFFSFVLSVSPYEDIMLAEGHVGLRLDAVEDTAYQFTNGLQGFRSDSFTLITPLGKLANRHPLRYHIKDEESLQRCAEEMSHWFEAKAIPFLKHHSRLEGLDILFNASPETACPWLNNPYHQAFRGLAVAALLRRDDLAVLAQQHRSMLHRLRAYEQIVQSFDRMERYVSTYFQPN
jgi:hypothetical protein